MISFVKYQGSGNDFILIEDPSFPLHDTQLIQRLCHRQFGIGADGLILIQPSSLADVRMRIFNADGGEATMCGNGASCLVYYKRRSLSIETAAGVLEGEFHGNSVRMSLGKPKVKRWGESLHGHTIYEVDTTAPHVVIFADDMRTLAVKEIGKAIRFDPQFSPRGVNVNFAKLQPDGSVAVRTYEKGVEDETLACGTGAAAVAFTAAELHGLKDLVNIAVQSGAKIGVHFKNGEVQLESSPQYVFKGYFNLFNK